MNLKFWRRGQHKIGVVFNSGKEVVVYCDDFNIEKGDGELMKYTIIKQKFPKLWYSNLNQIACLIVYY